MKRIGYKLITGFPIYIGTLYVEQLKEIETDKTGVQIVMELIEKSTN